MQETNTAKSKKSIVSIMIAAVLLIIMIPALIVNLTIIVTSFVDPNSVPGFLGYKPLIVLSGSMKPTVLPGDIVLVQEMSLDNLKTGDIIAYRSGESVITHRVLEITSSNGDRQFITKGDNNNTADRDPVAADMVEGVYLFRIPHLGNAAIFMQTPVGMILFIALPIILFILYDIFRRNYYMKRERVSTEKLKAELAQMKQQLAATETVGKDSSSESSHKDI